MTFLGCCAPQAKFLVFLTCSWAIFHCKNNDFQWILHQNSQKFSPALRPGCCETRGVSRISTDGARSRWLSLRLGSIILADWRHSISLFVRKRSLEYMYMYRCDKNLVDGDIWVNKLKKPFAQHQKQNLRRSGILTERTHLKMRSPRATKK